jgi:hypothetical protein
MGPHRGYTYELHQSPRYFYVVVEKTVLEIWKEEEST